MSVSSLLSWHPIDIGTKTDLVDCTDRKEKESKYKIPMFLLNNLPMEEIMAYEKYCQAETFETSHFLSSLSSFQMNHEVSNRMNGEMNETVVRTLTHTCNECGKSFLYKHHLTTHEKMHLHHDIKSPVDQQDHNKLVNTEGSEVNVKIRPHVCNKCGKSFVLKHHLTSHEKTHTGLRPHACEFCGKTFTHKHCLNTHLLLHSSQRPYQCMECKKRFTLKHHLISHTRVHNRDKPFICQDCGLAFALKRHLVTHSKFHAGKRPFICDECGESFAQKDQLVMHSRFHGSINSYVCGDCGDTFTRKFELVAHARIHGKLPHVCQICSKEFLQKRTLLTHIKEHSKEPCPVRVNLHSTPSSLVDVCTIGSIPSQFYATSIAEPHHPNLNINGNNHNEIAKQSLMCCQQCGSLFSSHEALVLHEKLHSGDTSLVSDIYTLASDIQNRNFPSHHHLHLNRPPINVKPTKKKKTFNVMVPNKVKRFVCPHCSKGFSEKRNLQQHEKRHPDGACILKPYACVTCNKAFHQKNHLVLHERLHMNSHLQQGPSNKMLIQPMHIVDKSSIEHLGADECDRSRGYDETSVKHHQDGAIGAN